MAAGLRAHDATAPTARSFLVRRLPTPFQPLDWPTTLAAPSCCCCCCLATMATATTFHARDGLLKGREISGRGGWAGLAGFLAPFALIAGATLGGATGGAGGLVTAALGGIVGMILFVVLSYAIAGGDTTRGAVVGLVSGLTIGVAFVAEVALVLVTVGAFWLLIPLFIWLGFRLANWFNGVPSGKDQTSV